MTGAPLASPAECWILNLKSARELSSGFLQESGKLPYKGANAANCLRGNSLWRKLLHKWREKLEYNSYFFFKEFEVLYAERKLPYCQLWGKKRQPKNGIEENAVPLRIFLSFRKETTYTKNIYPEATVDLPVNYVTILVVKNVSASSMNEK